MHSTRKMSRVTGLLIALATALALVLTPTAAQAGPRDRKDTVQTNVAVIAESLVGRGGGYPAKLTRKKLKRQYGFELDKTVTIAQYKRLRGGKHFRVCLRHRKGGWATYHSRKRSIEASGRGRACRF